MTDYADGLFTVPSSSDYPHNHRNPDLSDAVAAMEVRRQIDLAGSPQR
ncbi:MAG TPA: hypothetical protein VNC61_12895 [Acidimicrobiales bacterium]|nr:hypothetical protein [Acidimicrobiales bacterium]